jgi:hypothetical protein
MTPAAAAARKSSVEYRMHALHAPFDAETGSIMNEGGRQVEAPPRLTGFVGSTGGCVQCKRGETHFSLKMRYPAPVMASILQPLYFAVRSGALILALWVAPVSAMAQTTTIAESFHTGPLLLGDKPASVELAASQGAVGDLLRALRGDEQLYLVLGKLRAEGAVGAVYEVYFDLPAGVTPSRDDPHYVADFNFFDAESSRRGASFNITDLVARLQRKGALGESPTVTIVPNGSPSAAARPSVDSIAIVSRAR